MDGIIQDRNFLKEKYQAQTWQQGIYENCTFRGCDFSDGDLSRSKFIECVFEDCDLSMARLEKSFLQDIKFLACKILGLRFDKCDPFGIGFTFDGCQLDHSSFYGLKIKKTVFRNCQLREVDFAECDMAESVFDGCDLAGALFDDTNLEKADLRGAFNYSLDPEKNNIRKASFSLGGIPGLLTRHNINIE